MDKYLYGKTALVTGAGWGIGAVIALLYSAYGANVIVSDTSGKEGAELVSLIKHKKGNATFIKTDLSSPKGCKRLVRSTIEIYGSIDIACNNSGIFPERGYSACHDKEMYDDNFNLDLNGLFNCLKYEIEAMQKQGGGVIINLSYILSTINLISSVPYIMLKYGTTELKQNISNEYSGSDIRVNCISSALIKRAILMNSKQTEDQKQLKSFSSVKLSKVEEVAELVIWLSSDKAPFAIGI